MAPDVASLNLAIETHAATAQQSAGQNAALAQKVVDALNTKLQGKGKVWTGGYSLYPEYSEPRPNDKPVVTGYRAENSITVETGEIGMLGGLIDTAIEAGANRINFLNFTLRDESQARSQAIALAAKDAQTQADSLAKSLGVKLGPVVKATTEAENRPMPMMRMGGDGDEFDDGRADAGAAQRGHGPRDRFDYLPDPVAARDDVPFKVRSIGDAPKASRGRAICRVSINRP